MKSKNPVAKFAKRFNKAVVHTDRKKEQKKTGNFLGRPDIDDDFYDDANGFYGDIK